MAEPERHEPGVFCWLDLSTSDLDGAVAFYRGLLGWEVQIEETPEGPYAAFSVRGRIVAGGYRRLAREGDLAPHWVSYVTVTDADAAVARVAELGGTVVTPPVAVESDRLAIVRDPAGAMLGLWEPRGFVGFGRIGEPGAVTFFELVTHDPGSVAAFYRGLFRWEPGEVQTGPGGSSVFARGGETVAGMLRPSSDLGPFWIPYFQVEEIDTVLARVGALGGEVRFGPQTVESVGKTAWLVDPQGAWLALMEPGPGWGSGETPLSSG